MNDGLSEADLVLDLALRLEKLLLKQPGVEVVMTRRSNVFVPLEERTAIANREGADLFLSIHANASEDDRVRGIETYFLNFAPNPAAEAIAARENAASARTMRQLPDIVKAIALNNKIDESRDFASLVQASMLDRLKRSNKSVKDLGVKQAPFMVLIGATMPSILAEISFLTNGQEAALLRGGAVSPADRGGAVQRRHALPAVAEGRGSNRRLAVTGAARSPRRDAPRPACPGRTADRRSRPQAFAVGTSRGRPSAQKPSRRERSPARSSRSGQELDGPPDECRRRP